MKGNKQKTAVIAGLLFLVIGFWMIFTAKDNLGFLPAILGSLLVLWRF